MALGWSGITVADDIRIAIGFRGNETVVSLRDGPASNDRRVLHVGKVRAAIALIRHTVDNDLINMTMGRNYDYRKKKDKPASGLETSHLEGEAHRED
jgi:hypothetical protein